MEPYMLECCVDSVESAMEAEKGGADRLELCAALVIGGISPGLALFEEVRKCCGLPVRVLLRPRFGDFLYTERGWRKAAQICISHAFMIQDITTSIGKFDVSDEDYLFMKEFVANAIYDDYDRLVQLCDALAMPTGFCLLEKRFVDVTIRYGIHPATIDRWKKILEIKKLFEEKIGCSIYTLLPGVVENSFR